MARIGNITVRLDGVEQLQRAIADFHANLTPEQIEQIQKGSTLNVSHGFTPVQLPAPEPIVQMPTEAEIRDLAAERGESDTDEAPSLWTPAGDDRVRPSHIGVDPAAPEGDRSVHSIFGIPVTVDPNMPEGTAMMFADMNRYRRRRQQIQMQVDNEAEPRVDENGQRLITVRARFGGALDESELRPDRNGDMIDPAGITMSAEDSLHFRHELQNMPTSQHDDFIEARAASMRALSQAMGVPREVVDEDGDTARRSENSSVLQRRLERARVQNQRQAQAVRDLASASGHSINEFLNLPTDRLNSLYEQHGTSLEDMGHITAAVSNFHRSRLSDAQRSQMAQAIRDHWTGPGQVDKAPVIRQTDSIIVVDAVQRREFDIEE